MYPRRLIVFVVTACITAPLLAACGGAGGAGAAPKTSANIVAAFNAAGLEAKGARPMIRADYGMAPVTAIEGTRFFIPSLGKDAGGRALSFASAEDLAVMHDFYVKAGKATALLFSWVFESGNLLVQISGDLPEAQARQYEAALMGMR